MNIIGGLSLPIQYNHSPRILPRVMLTFATTQSCANYIPGQHYKLYIYSSLGLYQASIYMAAASDEYIIAKLVPEEVWCGRSQEIQYNSKVTYASLQWSGRTGS